MQKKEEIIIGLTGPIAGGKGTVADFLGRKGFFVTALSDRIRESLTRKGEKITRQSLQEEGDRLRKKFGRAVLSKRSLEIIRNQKKSLAVVDSIRAEGEVDFLKKQKNFFLIGVTAPRRLRYKRLVSRAREEGILSWKEFLKRDRIDFVSGKGEEGRNVGKCLARADFLIKNSDISLDELQLKVEKILKLIWQNQLP